MSFTSLNHQTGNKLKIPIFFRDGSERIALLSVVRQCPHCGMMFPYGLQEDEHRFMNHQQWHRKWGPNLKDDIRKRLEELPVPKGGEDLKTLQVRLLIQKGIASLTYLSDISPL